MIFYMHFTERHEELLQKDILIQKPLGQFLFDFLDTNWKAYYDNAKQIIRTLKHMEDGHFLVAAYYQKVCQTLQKIHPVFAGAIEEIMHRIIEEQFGASWPVVSEYAFRFFTYYPNAPVTQEDYDRMFYDAFITFPKEPVIEVGNAFVEGLSKQFEQLMQYQKAVEAIVLRTLDDHKGEEKRYPALYQKGTALHRYYLLQEMKFAPLIYLKKHTHETQVRQIIFAQGHIASKEDTQDLTTFEKMPLEAKTFLKVDDFAGMLLTEIEWMCEHGISLRRCTTCGRYFVPYSKAARYCDRLQEHTGQTCKQVSAAMNHKERVEQNDYLQCYRRLNNAYQMRCRRAPSVYAVEDYEAWKRTTKRILEEAEWAGMSIEEFEQAIALPPRK